MKALLICPVKRKPVATLAEHAPLAVLPILGKALIEYWLEYLVALGARDICISAGDRYEDVLACVSDGARWGLRITVFPEIRELSSAEARAKYRDAGDSNWLPAPHDALLMDHLPSQPEFPLFASYAAWFAAATNWLPRAATPDRIGVREIKPGVWVGQRTRVAASAELRAPCWLGEYVYIGGDTIIGPNVILENKAFVDHGVTVADSLVGPETFVGAFTEIHNSIAWGSTLVNWKRESCLKVPDAFLLCPLKSPAPLFTSAFQPLEVETP